MTIRQSPRTQFNHHRRGFTLIELVIVLAVASLMFAGLWRLIAGANQQVRDQAAATQMTQLIAATKAYLASADGQAWMTSNIIGFTVVPNSAAPWSSNAVRLPIPNISGAPQTVACTQQTPLTSAPTTAVQKFANYLPPGFDCATVNSYGQSYYIRVVRYGTDATTANGTYSFMIVTSGGDQISDTSGGRISGLIGNDGGFIYSDSGVCTPAQSAKAACGAYGAWSVQDITTTTRSATNPTLYGFTSSLSGFVTPTGGQIATRTFVNPSAASSDRWLARQSDPSNNYDYNSMSTNMYFNGANGLYLGNRTTMAATIATQNPTTTPTSPFIIGYAGSQIFMNALPNSASTVRNATYYANIPSLIKLSMGCTNYVQGVTNLTYIAPVSGTNQCPWAMSVSGDMTVEGQLNAYSFFAQKFVYTSDRRLKKDIAPIENGLDTVMKINPVSFTFKKDNRKSMGVIAQEIEKIYPQLVSDGVDGYKGVEYQALIAPLIAAVQELKKDNDDLRQQIQKMQGKKL